MGKLETASVDFWICETADLQKWNFTEAKRRGETVERRGRERLRGGGTASVKLEYCETGSADLQK